MSVSSILNIAKNAMAASQVSLQTTSHNVANVNTEGYSRQEAVLNEMPPVPTAHGFIGNGVTVKTITRYYDKYLEGIIANKNNSLQEQQVYTKYLTRIEGIFNEDNSQLSDKISTFFNSWQELTLDPTSQAAKQAIVGSGENLSTAINSMYTELKNLQIELNNNVGAEIDEINRITSSIASLNNLVFESGSTGAEGNDYLDERNRLIKELSGKLGTITFADEYNRVTVLTSNGKSLVDGGTSWQVSEIKDPDTGLSGIGWNGGTGAIYDITDQVTSGSLYAYVNTRDTKIGQFVSSLDALAKSLIENVNYFHEQGNGGDPDTGTGVPFFQPLDEFYAKDIRLSDQVKANIQKVMASSDASNTTDNDVALKIASLVEERVINDSEVESKKMASSATALNLEGSILVNGVRVSLAANDDLVDIANSINSAGAGVSATILAEGGKFRLNLQSTENNSISLLSLGRRPGDPYTSQAIVGPLGIQGDLSIQGRTINVATTDSLSDLVTSINAALPSSSPASFVAGRLVLTGLSTDDDISLLNGIMSSEAILQDLGITGSTFTGHVAGTVSTIGGMAKGASDLAQYHEDTMQTLVQQRESVSGVSIDEEMANLIKFQHAYQAAARLFTVADELLQNLLQSVGA